MKPRRPRVSCARRTDPPDTYPLFSKHAVLSRGVVVLTAVLTTAAAGSVVTTTSVTCPVCSTSFEALAVAAHDSRGGVDRDLFARSDGAQHVYFWVSTCTHCYYSGYLSDFDATRTLAADFKAKVQTSPGLKPSSPIAAGTDQRDIAADDRYALATRCYLWRGRSDEALAWLYLRQSWLVRENASVVPRDRRLERVLTYARRWMPPASQDSNQADRELGLVTHLLAGLAEGRFNRYQAPFVEMAAAMLLRRHGEHGQAEPLLNALRNEPLLTEPLRTAAARMADSLAAERRFQRQAITHFERAVTAGQVAVPNRAVALYLIGELHRRLGNPVKAVHWFDRAAADAALPPELQRWIKRQRRLAATASP